MGSLECSVKLTYLYLSCGKKLENLKGSHTEMGSTFIVNSPPPCVLFLEKKKKKIISHNDKAVRQNFKTIGDITEVKVLTILLLHGRAHYAAVRSKASLSMFFACTREGSVFRPQTPKGLQYQGGTLDIRV